MIDVRFRPLDVGRWPGERTPADARKGRLSFRAGWTDTLERLDYELCHLRAERIVIEADFTEGDIRLDGWPRANARQPLDPGVVVSFDSQHGPLRYATDTYDVWQHNARAIALGLEALRAVDRYGITHRAEQYVGYRALGAGIAMPATTTMTVEDAAEFIAVAADIGADGGDIVINEHGDIDRVCLDRLYRLAVKIMHPDVGGDEQMFRILTEARNLLEAHAR